MPYNERLEGDHRAAYVDFDTQALFGTLREDTAKRRGIIMNRPETVTKYLTEKYNQIEFMNYFKRLEDLDHSPSDAMVEEIDRIATQASMQAERKCRPGSNVLYSPELTYMRIMVSAHRLNCIQRHTGRNQEKQIATRVRGLGKIPEFPLDLREAERAYKAAKVRLSAAEKDEVQTGRRHLKFLEVLYHKHQDAGLKAEAARVKRIRNAEITKRAIAKCRLITGKNQN